MKDYTTKSPKKVIRIKHKEPREHLSSVVTKHSTGNIDKVLDREAQEVFGADRFCKASP